MRTAAALARQHHREALKRDSEAAGHRAARDQLVRQLRREDPSRWTYVAIARAVECSPELVAAILRR